MSSSAKKKKIKNMEKEDAQGVSRKRYKRTLSFETFAILKGVVLSLIPVMFFLYSPALVLVMAAYVALCYAAILTERGMNKSVIKANHIHIPKADSAIAAVIIVIALVGAVIGAVSVSRPPMLKNFSSSDMANFAGNAGSFRVGGFFMRIKQVLSNFGSLLTGKRSISNGLGFGTQSPPSGGGHGGFSFDDLPLQYLFSLVLSIVSTVLVCLVFLLGCYSLLSAYLKRRKFSKMMNEVIFDGEIKLLSDEELDEILSFGEETSAQGADPPARRETSPVGEEEPPV